MDVPISICILKFLTQLLQPYALDEKNGIFRSCGFKLQLQFSLAYSEHYLISKGRRAR